MRLVSLSAFLLMIIFFFSCKKDESVLTLYISESYQSRRAKFVTVFTDPPTETVISDKYGNAVLRDLAPNEYTVYAIAPGKGAAVEKVIIEKGSNLTREIFLTNEYPDFLPLIFVMGTVDNEFYISPTDTLLINIFVKNGIPGNFVYWESNIDGILGTSVIDDDLNSRMDLSGLSFGNHDIKITTYGESPYFGVTTIELFNGAPEAVYLFPIENEGLNYKFVWSQYRENRFFRKYELFESIWSPELGEMVTTSIKTAGTIWDTIFETTLINKTGAEYWVSVQADEKFSRSNSYFIPANYEGDYFEAGCNKMILNKNKPFVYLVYEDKITIYDYQNNEIISEKSISLIGKSIDIRYDGNITTLYVVTDFRVLILSGEDLSLIKTIQFTSPVISVAAISQDIIVTSETSDNLLAVKSFSISESKIIDELEMLGAGYSSYFLSRNLANGQLYLIKDVKFELEDEIVRLSYNEEGYFTDISNSSAFNNYTDKTDLAYSPNGNYFVPLFARSDVFEINGSEFINRGKLSNEHTFKNICFSPAGDTIYALTEEVIEYYTFKYHWFITYTYPNLEVVEEVRVRDYLDGFFKSSGSFFRLTKPRYSNLDYYYMLQGQPN